MKHEKSKNDAMRHELDHIDAKILNLLRENARMPLKEIAEHVFLSSSWKTPRRPFWPELSGWRRKATLQDIRSN